MKSGLTKQIHQKNPSAKTNVHEKIQVLFGDNPPPFVPKNLTANQSRPSEMRGYNWKVTHHFDFLVPSFLRATKNWGEVFGRGKTHFFF